MRLSVAIAVACLTLVGLSAADESPASIKKQTDIPAEGLGTALQTLAKDRNFQIVYVAEVVSALRTQGAVGEFTPDEALKQLLSGTGLTFRYLDESTVTIVSINSTSSAGTTGPGSSLSVQQSSAPEDPKVSSGRSRLAQVDEETSGDTSSVEKQKKKKASEDKADKLEEVQVNIPEILIEGSRIMNVDIKRTEDDPQPYYIFDSAAIQQSGATNVEDFLKQRLTMSATFLSQNQDSSGLGNTSTINLRGLGANETLILIDGRRSASVSVFGGVYSTHQPDINGIPLAAIERIEVLPSSASAIYGGAAMGGVVNIILKKNFQGGEIHYTFESTTSGNAPLRTVDATYGFPLEQGKTQIMLAGQYADAKVLVLQDRLDLTQRGISTIFKNYPPFFFNPSTPFSGATPNIASAQYDVNGNQTNLSLRNGVPLNSSFTYIPAGAAAESNLSEALLANAGKYNLNLAPGTGGYGLQSPIGTAPLVKSFTATIRRELTPILGAFTEFSTQSNASSTIVNPYSGAFFVPHTALDNPFQQDVYVNFPSAISAPDTSDSVTQSVTVGLLASLPAEWKSELDYTWSRNEFEFAYRNVDNTAINSALANSTVNPFVDTVAHPLNLSPYLAPETSNGNSTVDDLGLRASGPVGSFPWGRPTLTIGLEHRKEGSHDSDQDAFYPLTPANSEDTHYFGQSQSTSSVYVEALVPLVTAKNALPLIHLLDLQLAGRSERFAVYAGTPFVNLAPDGSVLSGSPTQGIHQTTRYTSTNPTMALKYKPVEDLTLRASYSTAFLPPTASQFVPNPAPVCGFPCQSITDPRNGRTYDVDFSQGGNPNLKPQTAQDWDFGVIWEPHDAVLKGLRMDLEYYKITQPNYITTPGAQLVVSNPAFASRVTRDPTTGLITFIDLSYLNAVEYKTNGWDPTIEYHKPTAFGIFDLHIGGTVVARDMRQYTIGGLFLNYDGYPADGGEGKIKANGVLSWTYRQWTVGWITTYYGSYEQSGSPNSPLYIQYQFNGQYAAAQGGPTIPSQTYHELYGSYAIDKTHNFLSNLTVQFGIKNLFNTLPPFDAFNGPSFSSAYGDSRLRDYWISLRKGFGP
jgi:outer membrane receptor protein involved in Fe transport